MSYFAVHYTYSDDRAGQNALRPEHRGFLRDLVDQGILVASGPLLGTEPGRALLVVRADAADQVHQVLLDDPFQTHGFVTDVDVVEWNPVIGILAEG